LKCEFWESTADMPWDIWKQIHETSDLSLVCKSGEASLIQCLFKWYDLKDEWIRKFGVDEQYKDLLETKREAVLKMAEYLQTNNDFTKFEAKMLIHEVNANEEEEIKIDMGAEKAQMQKELGFRIGKEWTVDDYYYQKKVLING